MGPAGSPQTHILKGQEDGQDESAEEESHEQHEERALAGGEVKLQGRGRCKRWPRPLQQAQLVLTPRTQHCFPRLPQVGPPRSSSPLYLSPAGDLSLEAPPPHPQPSPRPQAPELTLVWKLKTVTERQTRAVMPRHSSTEVVL